MKLKTILLGFVLILTLTACENELEQTTDIITEDETITQEVINDDEPQINDYGSLGALEDDYFTIEEMLVYAIQDEYAARTEYEYILNEFDVNTPFSNIIKSEETHISLLLPLFDSYALDVPEDTSSEHLIEISSLEETYATGVLAEELNIAMYNLFLEQGDLPDDLIDAFTKLRDASMSHLSAFQKNLDKY